MSVNLLAGMNPSQIAYTSKGNPYVKSDKGKTAGIAAGTAVGVTTAVIGSSSLVKKATGSTYLEAVKDAIQWVRKGGEVSGLGFSKLSKIINFCNKSKILRAGLLGTAIVLPFAVLRAIGKLCGTGYDKIVDMSAKRKADKQAQM